ncbi:polysaccharide biosynthesis/export family protein [Fulvivirga sp. 29W222]|uniref:Polysaccharide biosynthesis/export family protein n=2 Tax=Fulvivirga marina TaxID=2494733 RepID=A0A937FY06_9BACT|nr:polysaccharide biosynthesis/export family protein [Fulvivirga marina]
MIYLQDESFTEQRAKLIQNDKQPYRIQPNDIISVKVKSVSNTEISDIFNITPSLGPVYMAPGNLYLEGYSVNDAGQITLPVIGTVTVKDMTLEEVQQVIQDNTKQYLNNATVIVKLLSFKITVLGEVKNPGYHYVFNNQVTILEALGLAGDLTQYGNRKNIKLIRQHPEGNMVVLINLTDPKLLQSEYFYLMPNDVLYVEPLKATVKRTNLDLLSVLFSAATTTVLILSYIDSN